MKSETEREKSRDENKKITYKERKDLELIKMFSVRDMNLLLIIYLTFPLAPASSVNATLSTTVATGKFEL